MLSFAIERRVARLIAAYDLHAAHPVAIDDVVDRLGWVVQYRERIYPLFGFAVVDGEGQVMVVNANLNPSWQRFVIAHELGHWLAGHLDRGTRRETHGIGVDEDETELAATIIAAKLLIPRSLLSDDATVVTIARTCDVPEELVRYRFL